MNNTKLFRKVLLTVICTGILGEARRPPECKCQKKQFACVAPSGEKCLCIPINWKCDGDFDCEDGVDETDCVSPTCLPDWFLCKNGKCVKNDWKCDGENDCHDNSDEEHCSNKLTCGETERTCESGNCIPNRWWCDGDEDCNDGSDEVDCEIDKTCTEGEFRCGDGHCISLSYKCDGDFDCADGTDEECDPDVPGVDSIPGGNISCKEEEFSCRGSGDEFAGREEIDVCIPFDFVCDNERDCESGLDEANCTRPCTNEQFRCGNGQCLSLHVHCDGLEDCGDGSDETSCPAHEACYDGEFRCTDGLCISKNWRCDGDWDCKDGSDEVGCVRVGQCDEDTFQCQSDLRCVLDSWRCDGTRDCTDGSDELNCECNGGEYLCQSGECLASGKLCDGVPDCRDASDEKPVHSCNMSMIFGANFSSCFDRNGGCEHTCRENQEGQLECVCRSGYQLASDMKSCIDNDECKTEGTCSQTCNNTEGSFLCSCLSGYTLRPDGRTCKASGPALALLFTNRIDIRLMNPDRLELRPILRGLENAIGLDYHIEKGLMFWSDVTLDRIMSSRVNGSDVREVVSSGLESPGGVAVDWIHDLLYWTDSQTSRIEVSHLDGSSRKVLIWEKLEKPRALALHPLKSLMFWTDWGITPCLESAAMDGSMRRAVASRNVHWPNGITIDYTNNHLYWSDAKYHIIETAKLDGAARRAVVSKGLPHPFGITIFEDKVYWTDWETKSVNSANKFTGGGIRTIRNRLHFPMNIRTYHPLRQPKGENICLEGGCSHLCLPRPGGFTCACPTGFQRVNVTNCAENIKNFLVFTRKNDIRRISFDANERTDSVLPVKNLKNAVALDWYRGHPGYIYWSDVSSDTISRSEWNGKNQEVIVVTSLDSPAGIAVDWITKKIYWTDSGLNRIEVAMLDGSMRCVLVWTGLDRPRAIIVNPKSGYMFWSDWGVKSKIERAGMDGSNRTAIVTAGLKWPNGITFDHITQRLYWADAGMKVIESCNINGGERRMIVDSDLPHPFGITMDETKIYWTDWTSQSISYADKDTGANRGTLREGLPFLMDIRYSRNDRPHSPNPCSISNGGCSHLCLLAPVPDLRGSSDEPSTPYSCACPTGFALGSDLRNCSTEMNKFLVIARRSDIRVISLDVPYSADVRLNVNTFMNNVVDIAVDPIDGHLYWTDVGSRKISRTSLSSSGPIESVIEFGLNTVECLAVDLFGRLLYWTDGGHKLISVSTLAGKSSRVLISEHLDSPRAIALHYKLGYMYWTDWGHPAAKLERAGMDGSNRSVIISRGLVWPNGITIDYEHGWLIWGDANSERIERSDLLGNHRETLRSTVPHSYSLATMDGFLYWTDWQTRNVERLDLNNVSDVKTIRENMPSMMGIKAVTMNVTTYNKCGSNNGGCSHLCLRSPNFNIGFACACPTGIQLQADGKTCSNLPSEYLLFTDRLSIRRLSLEADKAISVQLPLHNLENTIALDYHYRKQLLFYTDVYLDVIRSSNLNGSDVRTIASKNLKTMDGLAVDWIANNLYWTDAGLNTISVSRLDGSSRKVIVDRSLDEPRALCVHPSKGLLFWTDWGGKPRIEKSYLDGTGRKTLVKKRLQWPNGLTVDYDIPRLFWVDAHHVYNRIESCDFNGRKRRVVVSPVPHGFAVTYLYDTLYWTDWQTTNIHSATFSAGRSKRKPLLKGIRDLMGIKAVSSSRQTGTNLCDSTTGYGRCTHLCLMRGMREYVCACPDPLDNEDDVQNDEDQKTTARVDSSVKRNCSLHPVAPVIRVVPPTTQYSTTRTTTTVSYDATPTTSVEAVQSQDMPYVIHLLAAFLAAAFVAFLLFTVVGVTFYRHLKRKRLRSSLPANDSSVSFRNRTYIAASNSTLLLGSSVTSTPRQTPTPSVQTVIEECEDVSEKNSLLERRLSSGTTDSNSTLDGSISKPFRVTPSSSSLPPRDNGTVTHEAAVPLRDGEAVHEYAEIDAMDNGDSPHQSEVVAAEGTEAAFVHLRPASSENPKTNDDVQMCSLLSKDESKNIEETRTYSKKELLSNVDGLTTDNNAVTVSSDVV